MLKNSLNFWGHSIFRATITKRENFLSHDSLKATGYFKNEVNFLKENGFKFIKEGKYWKVVK